MVRLSLGDNTELGGSVGGEYVRWNFFTDATVTVGGEVWVEGGEAAALSASNSRSSSCDSWLGVSFATSQ